MKYKKTRQNNKWWKGSVSEFLFKKSAKIKAWKKSLELGKNHQKDLFLSATNPTQSNLHRSDWRVKHKSQSQNDYGKNERVESLLISDIGVLTKEIWSIRGNFKNLVFGRINSGKQRERSRISHQ